MPSKDTRSTGVPTPGAGLDIVVVSHTHWDREWYRPFQAFRLRLVAMLDGLLDAMEAGSGPQYFLLDGQSALLEDYLALRPERAGALRRLLECGRLSAGPWYVQPDGFLASGESLVRNLLLGIRTAGALGAAAREGWLPDTFGHAAQLPQILRSFGVDTFVFSRGLGDHLAQPRLEFWWEAPNGDRVLALHQAGGYTNAGNLGHPSFWGDYRTAEPDRDLALAQLQELAARLAPQTASGTVAVWNGADHMPPQASLPALLGDLVGRLGSCRVRQGTIRDYARAVLDAAPELPVVRGELRGSRYQALLYSTLSSRIYLKQANHRVENLLVRRAEPLAALAWLAGSRYPGAPLREAWRLLLQNQAHDGICGCGIDEIHRDMLGRFAQAEQIALHVSDQALLALAGSLERGAPQAGSLHLLLFNALGQERREVVDVVLRLDECRQGYRVTGPSQGSEPAQILASSIESYPWLVQNATAAHIAAQLDFWRECIRQIDGLDLAGYEWRDGAEGAALHLHLAEGAAASPRAAERLAAEARQMPPGTPVRVTAAYTRVHLAFAACVPACGYALYRMEPAAPVPTPPAVRSGEGWIESDLLRVDVDPQGRFCLTAKRAGRTFEGQHRIEDVADAGDLYDFCPISQRDPGAILESLSCTPGPVQAGLLAELQIDACYRVPESLAPGVQVRSPRLVPLRLVTHLRLRAGCPWLEIVTESRNLARDHRLRVHFPSGMGGPVVQSDGQFAVTSRPARPAAVTGWCQPPSAIAPHYSWFGTGDGEYGLAVLSEGLPEHEAVPGAGGFDLALTLLRAVGELSRGDLATRPGQAGPCRPVPDAQCPGEHLFRYGLLPYQGDPLQARVPALAASFQCPPLVCPVAPGLGPLPATLSLVALRGPNLELSAVKQSESGDYLAIRFYNTSQVATRAEVEIGFPVHRAWKATAEEVATAPLSRGVQGYAVDVGPAEIVTILAEPAGGTSHGMD